MSSSTKTKSLLTEFDEICNFSAVLSKGCETEFIKFLKSQESCRKKWLQAEQGQAPLHGTIAKQGADLRTLEVKLNHTRNQLDMEMKRRMKAEVDKEEVEQQVILIRELLTDNNMFEGLSQKERQSLAFLSQSNINPNPLPSSHKRLSAVHEKSADILSASDLSFDRTDEDLDVSYLRGGKKWRKIKRPSAPPFEEDEDFDSPKRARIDQEETSVVTRVSFSNNGPIRTTTEIETGAKLTNFDRASPPANRRPRSRDRLREGIVETNDAFWEANPSFQNALKAGRQQEENVPSKSPVSRSKGPRQHDFSTKTVIKPETCFPCGKRIKFGKYAMKCRDCRLVCHPDCKDQANLPCIPARGTPGKNQPLELEEVAPTTPPLIPSIVIQLITEIERRGLTEKGLYRVPGSETSVKDLKEKLLQNREANPFDKIYDIHVLSGTLKDFLRKLAEPLVTFKLHPKFMEAADINDIDDSLTSIYQAISELPMVHRDTLAYVVLHLQRVAESSDCGMPASNLAKVFGPTVVGHASKDPEPMVIMNDTRLQAPVMERFLSIPSDFWKSFTNVTANGPQEHSNVIANPNTGTPGAGQGGYTTMLGPVGTPGKTPKKTPSSSSIGKAKSILTKTSLTPRFGSKSYSSKRKAQYFSSPTLK
ncbi:rac GTPase-activating protein 1-like isoform X2 [Apostichopus japonicus]|uniref:rac GTPase-activating protein 1-like isoform X2 n=1 Tax=Stichopus japonicus TaxID=307972 RepID=UPI003AB6CD81